MELVLDYTQAGGATVPDPAALLLGCFQTFLGHELPAKLVPLNAYAGYLRQQEKLDDEARNLLGRLGDLTLAIDSTARYLSGIGRLMRLPAWGPICDLTEVFDELVAIFRVQSPSQASGLLVVAPLPAPPINRDLVLAVMMQLVRNALASVSGGQGAKVEVRATPTQEGWEVRVVDNGPGFATLSPQLLEPFRPGLGLFLVRLAVARWRGRLTITSRPGNGATVTILIPRPSTGLADMR